MTVSQRWYCLVKYEVLRANISARMVSLSLSTHASQSLCLYWVVLDEEYAQRTQIRTQNEGFDVLLLSLFFDPELVV